MGQHHLQKRIMMRRIMSIEPPRKDLKARGSLHLVHRQMNIFPQKTLT